MPNTRTKAPGVVLSQGPYTISEGLFYEDGDTPPWNTVVADMCKELKIPDLTTRKGLRRVHASFNEVYKRLDRAYSDAQEKGDTRTMGGVVGIMAKLCADAILRDKLFDRGLLKKVMPLLEHSTRKVALEALRVVTHHGGVSVRQEIARHNRALVKVMEDHPDDSTLANLVIATTSHASAAVIACERPPDPRLVRDACIPLVLEATVNALRRPTDSHELHTHALLILAASTQHCSRECKANPSMLRLLAAFTRSNNINCRAIAFSALLRLPIAGCEFEGAHNPGRLLAPFQHDMPAHLSDILVDYGPEKAEISLTLRAVADFQEAIAQAMRDHDMYALGQKLVGPVQRTEPATADGVSPGIHQLTGKSDSQITRFTDILPVCAQALRAKGSPADLDGADILDMKFYMTRSRHPEAIALGNKAIERNRGLAYAYYVVSMGADAKNGLRAVKKGLKCKKITPFVRNQMLRRAVNHAALQGIEILRDAVEGYMEARAEGTAYLMSAWEDAKTYTAEAPPDGRHMITVLTWYMMLTIVIRGPELSEDLRELDVSAPVLIAMMQGTDWIPGTKPARRKIKTSVEFMNYMGYPIVKTQLNLARELILSLYTDGAREWGAFIKHFDELDTKSHESRTSIRPEAEDGLTAWLEKLDLDSSDDEPEGGCHGHG
ncbi:hypothetical protein ONZ51_g8489 [Trametes cubensis]|uniref:Uncharacterized protein n=1 Tax=Trametes cubensis TaxID=1111947 RepID=A0AAD7TQ45_9APHY|nr:hypothetical protein ONZ51_g8489 [Trametes cubensis]